MKRNAIIVYIDFDDTLYCHDFHWNIEEDLDYNFLFGLNKLQYKKELLNKDLLAKLIKLKIKCESEHIDLQIFVVTGCKTSIYYNAKASFIKSYCGDIINNCFSVSSFTEKIPFMKEYNKYLEQKYDIIDTFLIDDEFKTLGMCETENFKAMTPVYFEKFYDINE